MIYSIGTLSVNTLTHEVYRGTREISLSKTEFELLVMLMGSPSIVISRAELIKGLKKNTSEDSNIIDVYISYLRKKIEKGKEKKIIHTIRDFGYKIQDKEFSVCCNSPMSKGLQCEKCGADGRWFK